MKPIDFRAGVEKIRLAFKEILSNCYTEFYEINIETATGQIFTLEAFFGQEYIDANDKSMSDTNIVRPILHFQAKGQWANKNFDINGFFRICTEVFEEFLEMGERNELDSLIPILQEGEKKALPVNMGQSDVHNSFFLSITSSICGGTPFLRELLQESIGTIAVETSHDKRTVLGVGCGLSEHQKITALIEGQPINLSIPFHRMDNFKPFQKEVESLPVDDKYIFVAMSFQKDPLLVDTYNTIKRVVKGLKKGLRCERVDDIQDDFSITDKILDCIRKAKLIIVDLTDNRPNVYYELGYARALGKTIVLVAKEGEKPHFDVSHQNIIFYNNATSLEKSLNMRLRTFFK